MKKSKNKNRKKFIYLLACSISLILIYIAVDMFVLSKTTELALEISPKQAYNENMVIIDTRPPERCEQTGRAKNAYHLPITLDSSPKDYLQKVEKIAKGRPVAFICNTGRASLMIAQQYRESYNYKNMASIVGGMEGNGGWLAEKLPVDSCTQ